MFFFVFVFKISAQIEYIIYTVIKNIKKHTVGCLYGHKSRQDMSEVAFLCASEKRNTGVTAVTRRGRQRHNVDSTDSSQGLVCGATNRRRISNRIVIATGSQCREKLCRFLR